MISPLWSTSAMKHAAAATPLASPKGKFLPSDAGWYLGMILEASYASSWGV